MARRLDRVEGRPSAFQAGNIPSCCGSCKCSALSAVAAARRWLLLLLSPSLSALRRPSGSKPTGTLQGMARVRSGQAPAWPLVSGRSVRRGSGVKRDFACTFTRHFLPYARCPAVTVTLDAGGGDTYTQRAIPGPKPRQEPYTFHAPKNPGSRDGSQTKIETEAMFLGTGLPDGHQA